MEPELAEARPNGLIEKLAKIFELCEKREIADSEMKIVFSSRKNENRQFLFGARASLTGSHGEQSSVSQLEHENVSAW
jgi:hypothetical protein